MPIRCDLIKNRNLSYTPSEKFLKNLMIKTRFAPSPTGYLHVGGLRTALYSYLFAKKNQGNFILRIEDTDQKRYVEGAVENLINTLHWAGLNYDEGPMPDGTEKGKNGPYTQSHRTEIYKKHADILIQNGHAYRCFCTKERLEEMREKQISNKMPPMYDRHCLKLTAEEIEENIKKSVPFVIRQKMPDQMIRFTDQIRGKLQFDGKTVDDQVLVKSDGFPTYHLANVVDDHFMEITHVIRGEEWLPSTPKHIALYHSFGWEPPTFAHLPLLLNADRTKLSKRQGDVAVEDYIKKGYLPQAVLNFVAFLGWNPGGGEEKEIYTLEELIEAFSMEKIHKAGAVFNLEKLDWFNWRWRKKLFNEELFQIARSIDPNVEITEDKKENYSFNFQKEEYAEVFREKRAEKLLELTEKHLPENFKQNKQILFPALLSVEEKILKNPAETPEEIDFYFEQPDLDKELLTHEKMRVDLTQAISSLEEGKKDLEKLENWTENDIQKTLMETVERMGIKNGQLLWPLRAALTGKQFSPGVFEVAFALGKEESIKRINNSLNKVK